MSQIDQTYKDAADNLIKLERWKVPEGKDKFEDWWTSPNYSGPNKKTRSIRRMADFINHKTGRKRLNIRTRKAVRDLIESIQHLNEVVPLYRIYLQSPDDTPLSVNVTNTDPTVFDQTHKDTKAWNVYSFHLKPVGHNSPKIAKAVLWVDGNNNCILYNLRDGNRLDFIGRVETPEKKISSITLKSKEDESKRIFIQNYPCDLYTSNDFSVGTYITDQRGYLISGRLLFEAAIDEVFDHPVLDTYDHKHQNWNDIHPGIRKFLSLRRTNYHRLANHLESKDQTNDFMDEIKKAAFPHTRMIQVYDKPTVYVSWTSSFTDKNRDTANHVIDLLKTTWGLMHKEQLFFVPLGIDKFDVGLSKAHIKRTNLFICFMEESETHSFAGVQFGLALSWCQATLLFYKPGKVSSKIVESSTYEQSVSNFSWAESQSTIEGSITTAMNKIGKT